MPESEKVDASSQPCATGMQQQSYKSLLIQQVQKLKKQLPLYQTQNEGYEHQPKFRTTVWIDGVSYTSPNTFQQRKQAEADTSKIVLFATMQKLKAEALQHILEDKVFSKSILVEYSVRMNLQKPTYHTIKLDLESPLPVFRSSLVFNDLSYTGDDCRTKKEAEQSAARAVILKYLESETGNILSEIIKVKFNYAVTKDAQISQNDTNVGNVLALSHAKGDEVTKTPFIEPVNTATTTTTTTPAMNPPVNMTQTHVPQIPTQPPTQTIPIPQTSIQTIQQPIQTPSVGTNTAHTYSAPSVGHFSTIPATHHSNVVQQASSAPAMNMHPQISTQTYPMPTVIPTQTVSMPTVMAQAPTQAPIQTVSTPTAVLAQTPVSGTNNAVPISLPPSSGHFASIPANDSSSNVVQSINSEASSVTLQTTPPATGKKRNRKSKKNSAQKRTRDENQLAMSAMFHGQVPTFSAQ